MDILLRDDLKKNVKNENLAQKVGRYQNKIPIQRKGHILKEGRG